MIQRIILLFCTWRIILFFVALLAPLFIPLSDRSWLGYYHSSKDYPYLLWLWANSDGVHYLDIARNGYDYPNYAYFPLLPLLIKLVNFFEDVPFLKAGFIIANTSFFFAMIMFYRVLRLDYSRKIIDKALLFLVVFPTAFFYGAVYTDSLYLLFSLLSFYNARRRNWFYAGLFGYLTGLTRLVGFFLFPALFIEWYFSLPLKTRKSFYQMIKSFFAQRVYWVFLIPCAVVSYGLYLQLSFGDFFLFQKAMQHWGQSETILPPQVVYRYFKIFTQLPFGLLYFVALVEFAAAVFLVFLSIYVLRKVRVSYGVLMLGTILLPMFTGTFQGMPRYLLHCFPGFIGLALIYQNHPKIGKVMIAIFITLQIILLMFFTRGYFVA